jgi:hypothetical protein
MNSESSRTVTPPSARTSSRNSRMRSSIESPSLVTSMTRQSPEAEPTRVTGPSRNLVRSKGSPWTGVKARGHVRAGIDLRAQRVLHGDRADERDRADVG